MLELYFFNVGHGDSIAIKFPNDEWGIIDCFRNLEQVAPPVLTFLKKQDITHLNFVCITHPHSDHINGIDIIANNFEIDKFYLYGMRTGSPCEKDSNRPLIKALLSVTNNQKHINKMHVLDDGDIINISDISINICNPNDEIRDMLRLTAYVTESQDFNRESVVMFMQYANRNILLTGDITPNFWNNANKKISEKIDLIKISHHGSRFSNNFEQLSDFFQQGATAIISTDGGHKFPSIPDQEFIQNLRDNIGCNVICTSDLNSIQGNNDNENENLLSNDTIDLISEKVDEPKYTGYIKCVISEQGNISTELIKD